MTSSTSRRAADELARAEWPYVWYWRRRPIGQDRKGQRCRVLARGAMNSRLVEFEDGYRVVTSGNAIRRAYRKAGRG